MRWGDSVEDEGGEAAEDVLLPETQVWCCWRASGGGINPTWRLCARRPRPPGGSFFCYVVELLRARARCRSSQPLLLR